MVDEDTEDRHKLLIGTRSITRFRAGQAVFVSGESSSGVVLVRIGAIRVHEELRIQGTSPVHLTAAEFWCVGLLGAMRNERRRSTAIALEWTLATFVPSHALGQLFAAIPGLAQSIELNYHSGSASRIGHRLDVIPLPFDPSDSPTRASAGSIGEGKPDKPLRIISRPDIGSDGESGDPENRAR